MAIGKITQEMNYDKPPAETLVDLQRALTKFGKIKSIDQNRFTLKGKTKYGLQTVKIEATVKEYKNGSIISLIGKSDDFAGVGAKNGLERLITTLQNLDDEDFEVSETGVQTPKWLMWGYLVAVGLVILIFFIIGIENPGWLDNNRVLIGFVAAFLIWLGYYKVFKRT